MTNSSTAISQKDLVTSGPHKASSRAKLPHRPSTGRLTSPVQERSALLRGRIDKLIASCCIARLVVLAAEDQEQPIIVYIDSAGGAAGEALGLLSTMNGIRSPVATFCRGQVVGPAAIIAAHGKPGHRVAAGNARFSLRLAGFIDHDKDGFDSLLSLLTDTLAKDTGRPLAEVQEWFRTGAEFSAQEALRRGLLDRIADTPTPPQRS